MLPPNWIYLDDGRRPMARRRRRSALRMPTHGELEWLVAIACLALAVVAGLWFTTEGVG